VLASRCQRAFFQGVAIILTGKAQLAGSSPERPGSVSMPRFLSIVSTKKSSGTPPSIEDVPLITVLGTA